jgi:plastocyanin
MKTRGIATAALVSLLIGGLASAASTAARYSPNPASPSSRSRGAHSSSGHTVRIKGSYFSSYSFVPRTLTVKRGNTVTWLWHSDAAHNVTFHSLHKHSKTRSSATYRLRFPRCSSQRGCSTSWPELVCRGSRVVA